jgi:peptidase E
MNASGLAFLIGFDLPDGPLHDHALEVCGLGRPPEIAYVGSANGDDPGCFRRTEHALRRRHGARVHHVLAHPTRRARNEEILQRADVIYIAPGDVSRLSRRLHAAGFAETLRRRHRDGAMVVGVSAGAIALAPYWIEFPTEAGQPSLLPCLGALEIAVDCHDEDEDWPELRALLALHGKTAPEVTIDAYGIPRGGALILRDGRVRDHVGPCPKWMRLRRGQIEET